MDAVSQILVAALAVLFFLLVVGALIYIVSAIFLMKILRRAGFEPPAAAWVPLWNTASLLRIGGIAKPWVWVGILLGGSLVPAVLIQIESSLVSLLAWALNVVLLVVSVLLMVWAARGIQAGLGLDSAGGVVLAVLIPFAWLIWMGLRADKATFFDEQAVRSIGATFPLSKYVASIGN